MPASVTVTRSNDEVNTRAPAKRGASQGRPATPCGSVCIHVHLRPHTHAPGHHTTSPPFPPSLDTISAALNDAKGEGRERLREMCVRAYAATHANEGAPSSWGRGGVHTRTHPHRGDRGRIEGVQRLPPSSSPTHPTPSRLSSRGARRRTCTQLNYAQEGGDGGGCVFYRHAHAMERERRRRGPPPLMADRATASPARRKGVCVWVDGRARGRGRRVCNGQHTAAPYLCLHAHLKRLSFSRHPPITTATAPPCCCPLPAPSRTPGRQGSVSPVSTPPPPSLAAARGLGRRP